MKNRKKYKKIDLEKSKLLKTRKGTHVNQKRTICEVIREFCDYCVVEFSDDTERLQEMLFFLEDIFVMGIKMNNKLIEYKLDTKGLFEPNDKMTRHATKQQRRKRDRLIKILRRNKSILEGEDGDD